MNNSSTIDIYDDNGDSVSHPAVVTAAAGVYFDPFLTPHDIPRRSYTIQGNYDIISPPKVFAGRSSSHVRATSLK